MRLRGSYQCMHAVNWQVLALVGSGPALGNWDAAQAVRLSWREGHRWVANVQLEAGWHGALEFKVRSK